MRRKELVGRGREHGGGGTVEGDCGENNASSLCRDVRNQFPSPSFDLPFLSLFSSPTPSPTPLASPSPSASPPLVSLSSHPFLPPFGQLVC